MGEKAHLAYFDSPHGRIENLATETCGKNRNQLLLFPYWYSSQDDRQKGLHHHLFQDDRRSDKMALAYTTGFDATGKPVREYWICDSKGWQSTDEYDFHHFIETMTSLAIGWLFKKTEENNRIKKEQICSKAEALSSSEDWKRTHETIKLLQAEWKTVGSAGEEINQSLWQRFQSAVDKFYQRRRQHFQHREYQHKENQIRKEKLCSQAESLSSSTNWKETSETFKKLREQWKQIGFAGRNNEDVLWQRFRAAQDQFYDRRSAFYKQRDREQLENLNRKEWLCQTAESLVYNSDHRSATQRVKELQAAWKKIGHVPRDRADEVWQRFRQACDQVFMQAQEERQRKQTEWRSKMQATLERKLGQVERLRDSIEHDENNISRWRNTINNLRPGGRADVIRADLESKISDVELKIRSKRDRLYALQVSIRDIESKLR